MQTDTTRDRILENARRLIYTRSFTDVGVAEICEAAGVKKGSFYHFFASKQELALAVLDQQLKERSAGVLGLLRDRSLPPLERLRRLPLLAADYQEALRQEYGVVPGCLFGNLGAELSTCDQPIRTRVAEIFSTLEGGIERLLREAQDRGDIEGLDVSATARAMFAYFEGVILTAKTRNDPGILRELGPAMLTLRIAAPS
jgi:TetR/AcrR family transcriptional repressor of nem operon